MNLTPEQQADIEYLRSQKFIVIPSQFSYWVHNTIYVPAQNQTTVQTKGAWTEIPTEGFTTKNQMSFVTRKQRVRSALDYNTKPATTYKTIEGAFPFQIRVIKPKRECFNDLFTDLKTKIQYAREEDGLGNDRHPKLPKDRQLVVIGFSCEDECSNVPIDIVYCVDVNDLSLLVPKVKEIPWHIRMTKNKNITISGKTFSEEVVPTVLHKAEDLSRWKDVELSLTPNGVKTIKPAGYKMDYLNGKGVITK